ncbi:hypothetical protein CYMTET_7835, partial [Cymbomonas tetramitiformis]
ALLYFATGEITMSFLYVNPRPNNNMRITGLSPGYTPNGWESTDFTLGHGECSGAVLASPLQALSSGPCGGLGLKAYKTAVIC